MFEVRRSSETGMCRCSRLTNRGTGYGYHLDWGQNINIKNRWWRQVWICQFSSGLLLLEMLILTLRSCTCEICDSTNMAEGSQNTVLLRDKFFDDLSLHDGKAAMHHTQNHLGCFKNLFLLGSAVKIHFSKWSSEVKEWPNNHLNIKLSCCFQSTVNLLIERQNHIWMHLNKMLYTLEIFF